MKITSVVRLELVRLIKEFGVKLDFGVFISAGQEGWVESISEGVEEHEKGLRGGKPGANSRPVD